MNNDELMRLCDDIIARRKAVEAGKHESLAWEPNALEVKLATAIRSLLEKQQPEGSEGVQPVIVGNDFDILKQANDDLKTMCFRGTVKDPGVLAVTMDLDKLVHRLSFQQPPTTQENLLQPVTEPNKPIRAVASWRMSRDLDAKVAEKILGWRRSNMEVISVRLGFDSGTREQGWEIPVTDWPAVVKATPHFTTDASADYEVLRHVRENWRNKAQQAQFDEILIDIWTGRWNKNKQGNFLNCVLDLHCLYEPGDYSKAALMALGETV